MKKIIALRVVIAIIITYNVAAIAMSLLLLSQLTSFNTNQTAEIILLHTYLSVLINEITLFPGLVILYQAVQYFVRRGYFNAKSASKFKISGVLLMISSVTGYILPNFFWQQDFGKDHTDNIRVIKWFESLPLLFIVLLIGFGLYTLSDFIRRGEAIGTENKLTI